MTRQPSRVRETGMYAADDIGAEGDTCIISVFAFAKARAY